MTNVTRIHIHGFCVLAALLLCGFPQLAFSQDPMRLTLTIEPQAIRFSTPAGDVLDWRLEVVDRQNRAIFDSSFVAGNSLTWGLVNSVGQGVESGVYEYVLSIRGAGPMRTRRGELLVQRTTEGYQVWAISDRQTALATNGETMVTVTGSVDASIGADATVGTSTAEPASQSVPTSLGALAFPGTGYISGAGTTGRVTKWVDGPTGVVGDTQMAESAGALTVGNGSFTGNVHIFGASNNDVFAGMGPDVAAGPAFNFGYAGHTFGRSAGFLNVRPDASAVAPNPSLRFMTGNFERMIITNTGNVGIGTVLPSRKLHVSSSDTRLRLNTTSSVNSAVTEYANFTREWHTGVGGSAAPAVDGEYYIYDASVAEFRMTIDSLGRVGIGTTTPGAKLQVYAPDRELGIYTDGATYGILGSGTTRGVSGSGAEIGVFGFSGGVGVRGEGGVGVRGVSGPGVGVIAESVSGNLVEGYSSGAFGSTRTFHITNAGSYVAGSDFAEALPVDEPASYEPGDVLILSEQNPGGVEKTTRPYDQRVAGVYSTRPGVLGAEKNGTSRVDANDVPVAIVGIVPTKVSTENGPVRVGDLLTTSSTPGHAMKASPVSVGGLLVYPTGTILGKALEPFAGGRGVIKVLVTLK